MARDEWEPALIESAETVKQLAPAARAAGVHPDTVRYHMRRDQSFAARVDRALGRTNRRIGAGLLLALLLVVPCAATMTSSPVDLGTAGLSVTVGLRRWQESAPTAWPTVSNAGVTVNDLGAGLYSVSGLPLATGTDRYSVRLSAGGVGLASYAYGAQPGVRLVWQEEVTLPAQPTTFRRGDTFGSLAMTVRRGLPAAACAPETTATFTTANAVTGAVLFSNRAAIVSGCALDGTTSSYGLVATYDIQSGDLATVGKYVGTFKVCYSPSSCQTLPSINALRFEVVKALGD